MEPTRYTLVTGASSGLGREIAVRLAQNRRLILHGRDAQRLNQTRQLCPAAEQHLLWPFDLQETGRIEAALRQILGGPEQAVEGFVHCAGALKVLPMRSVDLAGAKEILEINFFAAAEIIRLLLKKNINGQNLRHIVFISSTASLFGAKGFNLYSASKGALDSLMRALAVELAPQVRVNSVLPGGIRTPMTAAMYEDPALAARLDGAYPLGPGRPADIADAVEFLLSEKARWITGQQLVVDGGQTANISA